jgi:hypothetical protein
VGPSDESRGTWEQQRDRSASLQSVWSDAEPDAELDEFLDNRLVGPLVEIVHELRPLVAYKSG